MGFSLSDLNPFNRTVVGNIADEGLRFIDDKILGGDASDASLQAAEVQAQAGRDASALLDPFRQLGQTGIDLSGFLTDPQQQFDFLQSNPLFQLGLDNLNQQTLAGGRARGRGVGSTDTQQLLTNNALLAATPLISQQRQSINDLLGIGLNVAGNQGNLLTGQAASTAGGIVGSQNAQQQGINNLLNLTGFFAGIGG